MMQALADYLDDLRATRLNPEVLKFAYFRPGPILEESGSRADC
jgi:hypothetical protein